jgi:hypothetical protein
MRVKQLGWACLLTAAAVYGPGAGIGRALGNDDIKLTGCVVRGEHGGYLLTNAPGEPAWQTSSDTRLSPGAVGTTGGFAEVFYWMRNDGQLGPHVGHRVEVEGDLKGDLKDGEIKSNRKDSWTELEISSDGDTLKARVPHASVVPGRKEDQKMRILVRKVEVKHVRMIAASCQ